MKLFIGAKALIERDGKILLIREAAYDEGTNLGKWDVPGGRIEPHEPILVGLAREVMEESGLNIVPQHVLTVEETFPIIKGEACHIIRVYYLATTNSSEVVLSPDHNEYQWVDEVPLSTSCASGVAELVAKHFANRAK